MKLLAYFICLLSFVSCSYFTESAKDEEVARVGEKYLMLSTINEITNDLTQEDSQKVASSYIDNWIKEELLIQKAIQNLSEDQLNFEQQLEDYKNSLIIYAYENALVRQKLDTIVDDKQVQQYYYSNTANFILKEDLASCQMLKCKASAPSWRFTPTGNTKR